MQTLSTRSARLNRVLQQFTAKPDSRKAKRVCNILGTVVRTCRKVNGPKWHPKGFSQDMRKTSVKKWMRAKRAAK